MRFCLYTGSREVQQGISLDDLLSTPLPFPLRLAVKTYGLPVRGKYDILEGTPVLVGAGAVVHVVLECPQSDRCLVTFPDRGLYAWVDGYQLEPC